MTLANPQRLRVQVDSTPVDVELDDSARPSRITFDDGLELVGHAARAWALDHADTIREAIYTPGFATRR